MYLYIYVYIYIYKSFFCVASSERQRPKTHFSALSFFCWGWAGNLWLEDPLHPLRKMGSILRPFPICICAVCAWIMSLGRSKVPDIWKVFVEGVEEGATKK